MKSKNPSDLKKPQSLQKGCVSKKRSLTVNSKKRRKRDSDRSSCVCRPSKSSAYWKKSERSKDLSILKIKSKRKLKINLLRNRFLKLILLMIDSVTCLI